MGIEGAVVAEAVHEESGRSGHPVLATVLDVVLDARAHGFGLEIALEAAPIEADRYGELQELGATDGKLAIEDRGVLESCVTARQLRISSFDRHD